MRGRCILTRVSSKRISAVSLFLQESLVQVEFGLESLFSHDVNRAYPGDVSHDPKPDMGTTSHLPAVPLIQGARQIGHSSGQFHVDLETPRRPGDLELVTLLHEGYEFPLTLGGVTGAVRGGLRWGTGARGEENCDERRDGSNHAG